MTGLDGADSEKRGEALRAIAKQLNSLSYDSDTAYPPQAGSTSEPSKEFVDGYQLGLFVAAESSLDVLRDRYDLFDNNELDAMLEDHE
ncbi:hypothetical protein ACFFQF_30195 [Haladaptatus pallidirubidus]|uniref:Uncharacterized protein n=1 Tax=Haladaptatus pallidirubidus TaxID=1008152 RepID=A0AAV3UI62_9EURY|nr:hypothetical protein [Haladaptatus pallidirubidus]